MLIDLHQLDRRFEGLRVRRPEIERQVLGSVRDRGQQVPIVVVANGDVHVVIDGFVRVRALASLGVDQVEVTLWDLPADEALLLARTLRSASGPNAVEEGWLLQELVESGAWTHGTLAERVTRSRSWVSRRIALVRDLPESVLAAVRSGRLPAHAAVHALLPLARTDRALCERVGVLAAGLELTAREVERLANAVVRARRTTRERILDSPLLFLRSQPKPSRSPGAPGERLLGELEQVVDRVGQVEEQVASGVLPEGSSELVVALTETERRLANLREALAAVDRKENSDGSSSSSSGGSGAPRSGDPAPPD